MAIDASIALRGPQTQLDPMGSMARGVGLGMNMLQARVMGQQIQDQKALSQAYSNSLDPATGQINYNKLLPEAARAGIGHRVPEIMNSVLDQRNKQLQYDTNQFDLTKKRFDAVGDQIAALYSDPKLGKVDMAPRFIQTLAGMVQSGMLDPQMAKQFASQIPRDLAGQQQWLRDRWMGHLEGEQQLKAMMPNVQTMDLGGKTVTVGFDPMKGTPIQGTVMEFGKSMAPGEAATPVTITNPDGSPTMTTKGAFAASINPPNTGTGVNGSAQGMAARPGQQGVMPGVTGPTPARLEASKVLATKMADDYAALNKAAVDAQTTNNTYGRALELLKDPSFTTGAGSGTKYQVHSMVQNALGTFGITPSGDNTRDFQLLHKYLSNGAANAASAAGYSGSDARMQAFREGQPNPDTMKPEALADAISYTMALNSGAIARNQAAEKWVENNGGDISTLSRFNTQWSKAFNPDVMEFRNLPEQERQAFISKLSESGRKNIAESYKAMAALGAF